MAGNAKLGWATAGAIAWAYLGLLAALGPGVREGLPPLGLQLGHAPGSIVIQGRLLALTELGGLLELRIGTLDGRPAPVQLIPPGQVGRAQQPETPGKFDRPPRDEQEAPQAPLGALPATLPPNLKVEFVLDPGGEPRKPEFQLESGERPFRLPGGGAGLMTRDYLVHIAPGEVRLVPREAIGEKLRERMRRQRDGRSLDDKQPRPGGVRRDRPDGPPENGPVPPPDGDRMEPDGPPPHPPDGHPGEPPGP